MTVAPSSGAGILASAPPKLPMAVRVAEGLRDLGIRVCWHAGGGSFKAQMRRADASGAALALIIGDDEAAAGCAAVKPLRAAGEQRAVAEPQLAEVVQGMLRGGAGASERMN
jgi:histidyl-tRNA synthetase